MKKLLIAACMFLGLGTIASAQTVKKAPAAKVAPATTTTTTAAPLKADGTPDKRFKANKAAPATPAGPLKKDGTPDKRYKANKKN